MTITRSTDQMPRDIEHLSFSQMSTLSQCGMKYLIEKGYGERGQPNWASVGGTAVHSLTEHWDRQYAFQDKDFDLYSLWAEHLEAAILAEEERSEVARTEFRPTGRKSAKWPNKYDQSWWDENGPIIVHNWMTWRQASPWDLAMYSGELAAEVGFEMLIGDAPVKGSIDRVFITPGENPDLPDFVVVDIKTGMEPSGYLQLNTYNAGLRYAWSLPPEQKVFGAFWMGKENTLTNPIDLSFLTQEYLDQIYWRADQIRKQGLFLPVVDKHCSYCGVKKFCPAFGGSLPDSPPPAIIVDEDVPEEGE